jgi:hypothetical protein
MWKCFIGFRREEKKRKEKARMSKKGLLRLNIVADVMSSFALPHAKANKTNV